MSHAQNKSHTATELREVRLINAIVAQIPAKATMFGAMLERRVPARHEGKSDEHSAPIGFHALRPMLVVLKQKRRDFSVAPMLKLLGGVARTLVRACS
jgi:hypothetical protein